MKHNKQIAVHNKIKCERGVTGGCCGRDSCGSYIAEFQNNVEEGKCIEIVNRRYFSIVLDKRYVCCFKR